MYRTPGEIIPGVGFVPSGPPVEEPYPSWATSDAKALELVEGRGGQRVQRWSFILVAIQDNMNHYGNLVVYVRLNGLVPPRSAARN